LPHEVYGGDKAEAEGDAAFEEQIGGICADAS